MNVGAVDERLAAAGINNTRIEQSYLALAETMGLYAVNGDNASLSKKLSNHGAVMIEDDASYIYNLKEYDVSAAAQNDRDSYYLVSYNSEGAFVDAAFGYSDLSGGYNSVDSYIDPFDPEITKLLRQIPGLDDPRLSAEDRLVKIYNYIINNFSYVPDEKDDWNFVSETIYRRGGDCEDLSILLSSAMIASLLQDGLDYESANKRVAAVAGRHAVYGDHVYVEYQADDGQTYVLDAAFAEQGQISQLADLQQSSDLQFTVYFRFNDNKVFGDATTLGAARSCIDPEQECLQPLLEQFERETDLQDATRDELILKLFNFLKTGFSVVDVQDYFPSLELLTQTKVGNSQGLSLLLVNTALAMAHKLGLELPNIRLCEAERDGEKQYVVIYEDESGIDRVLDFTDKIVDPQMQLDLVNTLKDLFSINAYMPAKELAELVKYGREYGLGDDLYGRRVARFNPAAGYVADNTVSTYKPLDKAGQEKITEFYKSKYIGGFWTAGSYDAAYSAVNSMRPSVSNTNSSGTSGFSDAFYNNNQFITQQAVAEMANIGTYITGGDFWSFDDIAFEKARAKLLFRRNLLSVMAMLVEAEMESHNIVASELEMAGSEEGYKSMKASQIIQAETDFLIKGVNELKKEATGIVSQHNELMDAIQNKKQDEIQKYTDDSFLIASTISTAASMVANLAINAGFSALEIAGVAACAIPFVGWVIGPAMILAGVLGSGAAKGILEGMSSVWTLTQDISKYAFAEWKASLASDKAYAVQTTLKNSINSTNKEIATKGQETTLPMVKSKNIEASAVSTNLFRQYGLLGEATKIKFLKGEDGLYYDDDERLLLFEHEINKAQVVNRMLVSLHGAKAQSRSAVHQEMTGKSSYSSTNVAQTMIEQEQSIIIEKFNELKQLRQEYTAAMNQKIQAKFNAIKMGVKMAINIAAYALGMITVGIPVVGVGPSVWLGIANTLFLFTESVGLWDKDDWRPMLQTNSLLSGSPVSNMELSGYTTDGTAGYNMISAILGDMGRGSAINMLNGNVGQSGKPHAGFTRKVGAVAIEIPETEVPDAGSGSESSGRDGNPSMTYGANVSAISSAGLATFWRKYSWYSSGAELTLTDYAMGDTEYADLRDIVQNQYNKNIAAVNGISDRNGQTVASNVPGATDKILLDMDISPDLERYLAGNSNYQKIDGKWYIVINYLTVYEQKISGYTSEGTPNYYNHYSLKMTTALDSLKAELQAEIEAERLAGYASIGNLYHNSNFRFRVEISGPEALSSTFKNELTDNNKGSFHYEQDAATGIWYLYMKGPLSEDQIKMYIKNEKIELPEGADVEINNPQLSDKDRELLSNLQSQAEKYLTSDEDDMSKYYFATKFTVANDSGGLSAAQLAEAGLAYDSIHKILICLDEEKFKAKYSGQKLSGTLKELMKIVDPGAEQTEGQGKMASSGNMASELNGSGELGAPEATTEDDVPEAVSDGYSNEKPETYQMMYRARIAKMRYDLTRLTNIKRCIYMLARYDLESRNIVHQEMTNTTTYQVSANTEQALTAEYNYVNSVIAAYSSREEQRIQTNNSIFERDEARAKSLATGIAGPFGFLVALLWKNKAMDMKISNSGVSGVSGGLTSTEETDLGKYRQADGSSTTIKVGNTELNVYNLADYSEFIVDNKAEVNLGLFSIYAFQYVPNVEKLQKATAAIYSSIYSIACLQSLYSAKSASRSMVHSILTNVSNLTLSSYSGAAIQADNALVTAKAQDLSKNASDMAGLMQKKAEAEQEYGAAAAKAAISGAGMIVTALAAIPMLTRTVPEVGGWITMINTVGNLLNCIFDVFYSIFKAIALHKLADANEEKTKELVEAAKENEKKARENSIGSEEGKAEAKVEELGENMTGAASGNATAAKFQISMMQAQMKKVERIKALIRKMQKAKNDSRGKITAKMSGTPGA
ncbi:hypothetical protein NO2_1155, partial [Candidatus Termititenax persephonae]